MFTSQWILMDSNRSTIGSPHNISALNLYTIVAQSPGSPIYLAHVCKEQPKPNSSPSNPTDFHDLDIYHITTAEFSDVFPADVPHGYPPDQSDDMHIETTPLADTPVCPVIHKLDELHKQLAVLHAKA
jgi:hypothetical protein